jgi:hypothetical protein
MTTPEQIEFTPPAEPPVNSVIVGRTGFAYQRLVRQDGTGWFRAGISTLMAFGKDWAWLLVHETPMTIVHRGDEPDEASDAPA